MTIFATLITTLSSGLLAAGLALAADGWRVDRARRQVGRAALDEFQRVLADRSSYIVIRDASLDETPLEEVSHADLAAARRVAYPYRDLLEKADRGLVTRNSIPFDLDDRSFIDVRQPVIDQWAMDLEDAITRAFGRRWLRHR